MTIRKLKEGGGKIKKKAVIIRKILKWLLQKLRPTRHSDFSGAKIYIR